MDKKTLKEKFEFKPYRIVTMTEDEQFYVCPQPYLTHASAEMEAKGKASANPDLFIFVIKLEKAFKAAIEKPFLEPV